MKFYKSESQTIKLEGKRYELTPFFDNVLNAIEIAEGRGTDQQKCRAICSLLLKKSTGIKDVETAVYQLIDYLFSNSPEQEGPEKNPEKAFDFSFDSDLIFSAFFQAYGINLIEQQGKMPWSVFFALFSGLPDTTLFKQVVGIRLQPVPLLNKTNENEITEILKLKAEYRLPVSEKEKKERYQEASQDVINAFLRYSDAK